MKNKLTTGLKAKNITEKYIGIIWFCKLCKKKFTIPFKLGEHLALKHIKTIKTK